MAEIVLDVAVDLETTFNQAFQGLSQRQQGMLLEEIEAQAKLLVAQGEAPSK